MLSAIKEHSGEGLPASLVERMSMLKYQPALVWAALWIGLVFGLQLHQRPAMDAPVQPSSVKSFGMDQINEMHTFMRSTSGYPVVEDLPASAIASLQILVELAGTQAIQAFEIPAVYGMVHAAFLSYLDGDEDESWG
eukprot:gene24548-10159_t